MAAVEIPDTGPASASVYDGVQHAAGAGPRALAPVSGTIASSDLDGGLDAPAPRCTSTTLPSATITTMGTTTSAGPAFGPGSNAWGSFVFAGSGQPAPTMTVTADGAGFRWIGQLTTPLTNNYEGVGLYFSSAYCADVSAYTGVAFDLAGDRGGCSLAFGGSAAADDDVRSDPSRGHCLAGMACYGPVADVTAEVVADAGAVVTIHVPFASQSHGSPVATLDPSTLVSLQWVLTSPGGAACAADLTIENVAFY
jgi:hypothetical protein